MKRVPTGAAVLVAFCALPSGTLAEQATTARRKPAVPARSPSVSGRVMEFYTGTPYANLPLEMSFYGCKQAPNVTVTTDASGQFRFEGLPHCDRFMLARPVDGRQTKQFTDASGKPLKPALDKADIGTLVVSDDGWPVRQFAGLCAGGKPTAEASTLRLAANIAVLSFNERIDAWEAAFRVEENWLAEPILAWPGVLCLKNSYTPVGHYVDKEGKPVGRDANRRTTAAVLVRLADGRRFETSVSVEPPPKAPGQFSPYAEIGDTDPLVKDWLRKVAGENP